MITIREFCEIMEHQDSCKASSTKQSPGHFAILCTECPFGFFGSDECKQKTKFIAAPDLGKDMFMKYNWTKKLDELL